MEHCKQLAETLNFKVYNHVDLMQKARVLETAKIIRGALDVECQCLNH